MAKYFIANRSVVGVVTINKEALDFKNRGFAPTDNDETYEAAKCLKTLGYEPYTEDEFKEKFSDNYNEFVGAADMKVEAAKKTLEESEKALKEQEPKLAVESVANIVACQNTLKEVIEGGDVTNILSAEEGLKQAWESAKPKPEETPAPSFEEAQGEQVPAENGTVETPAEGEQVSGEVETETGEKENLEPAKTDKKENTFEVPESPEQKAKLTRSIKAKLADAKRKWDSSEDEEEKAKLKSKIETFENQLKQLQ
jgi:hypothetical protein